MSRPNVSIIGPGRAGLTLGYALLRAGAASSLTYFGRRPEPPNHPIFDDDDVEYVYGLSPLPRRTAAVFLAIPDAVVSDLAIALAEQGGSPEGCVAFHLSGVLATDVLTPLHEVGYSVGSFHILQAFAHPVTSAARLPGSFVAVTGEPGATAMGRAFCSDLGCPVLSVPESRRPSYHAAAVMASNFLPALLDVARRALVAGGVDADEALPALLPLVRGTLANIEEVGLEASITGPLARGDIDTVGLHLRALQGDDRTLYARLGMELARLLQGHLDEDLRRSVLARLQASLDN